VIDEHADQVTLPDSTCNSGDPGWIDDGGLGGKAGAPPLGEHVGCQPARFVW
jgi:hypothetical protein